MGVLLLLQGEETLTFLLHKENIIRPSDLLRSALIWLLLLPSLWTFVCFTETWFRCPKLLWPFPAPLQTRCGPWRVCPSAAAGTVRRTNKCCCLAGKLRGSPVWVQRGAPRGLGFLSFKASQVFSEQAQVRGAPGPRQRQASQRVRQDKQRSVPAASFSPPPKDLTRSRGGWGTEPGLKWDLHACHSFTFLAALCLYLQDILG